MIDLLLLAGVALCALSVVMAIIAVARTQAPRGAAVAMVLGIVAVFAGSALDDRPFGVASLTQSWQRVISGEGFGNDTVTAPPPAISTQQTAADAAPADTGPLAQEVPAAPGTEMPADTAQAPQQ